MIRKALSSDIPSLVALDHASYGDFGANEEYFRQKISSPNAKIVVTETDKKITGFVIFEVMEPSQPLQDFSDLYIATPIKEGWMHIIAFTTTSNFKNVQEDTILLQAAENEAIKRGCTTFCVPLSIDHPYRTNDVFGFWEKNGYHNSGTITWIASSTETIGCYFFSKPANNS